MMLWSARSKRICVIQVALLMLVLMFTRSLSAEDWFVDVTTESGVDFDYANGGIGEYYFPEIMGGGAALLDYDRDGLLDLYLVQGGAIGPGIGPENRTQRDRLYRNISTRDAKGNWKIRFEDVTDQSGIDARGYGMGVASDDVSGDGYPDLYVMNFGSNQLWLNNGDGTFSDVTGQAGVDDPRWSVSGSFGDLNNDGLLDLIVVNYADYTIENHRQCRASGTNRPDYCSPSAYSGVTDSAFLNRGDGTFQNISESMGLNRLVRHGLGVIVADFDWNGHPDVYVANDGTANAYLLNQGNLKFIEDAFLAGSAVNSDGAPEASMGVDAADFDRNGGEDIFITHLKRETNTLYANDGRGWFRDATTASGLGPPSLPSTGFGTAFLDIDNDGWLDLIAVNGAVVVEEDQVQAGSDFPYRQVNQIFRNTGNGRFEDATERGGEAFEPSHSSRGAAFGDLNNDGLIDAVIVNSNGPARVLLNRASGHHWLGLNFRDSAGKRDLSGAVTWLLDDDRKHWLRRSRTDGSYASANDPRVVLGLADNAQPQAIHVRWPNGQQERFSDLKVDQYHVIRKGQGSEHVEQER